MSKDQSTNTPVLRLWHFSKWGNNKALGHGITSMQAMRAAAADAARQEDDWAARKENEPDGNRRREPRASLEDAPVAGNKGDSLIYSGRPFFRL